jgi:hypothetical protein
VPVINGNNSQLNNSPAWAVLSPWTVTISDAMLFGQPTYRLDGRLNLVTGKATMAGNEKRGYSCTYTSATAIADQTNDKAHYQSHISVLRPGQLTSKRQAAAAEIKH